MRTDYVFSCTPGGDVWFDEGKGPPGRPVSARPEGRSALLSGGGDSTLTNSISFRTFIKAEILRIFLFFLNI